MARKRYKPEEIVTKLQSRRAGHGQGDAPEGNETVFLVAS